MRLVVKTIEIATGAKQSERVIDDREPEAMDWLDKHTCWACNNGLGIVICNELDDVGT